MSIFKSMDFHVVPAYGRDYKNQKAALADWHAGKDFILSVTGQYISKRDIEGMCNGVWIRYSKLQKICKAQ